MIIRVIVQNQYKEELHDNEWFADMGDWRSAEGYLFPRVRAVRSLSHIQHRGF